MACIALLFRSMHASLRAAKMAKFLNEGSWAALTTWTQRQHICHAGQLADMCTDWKNNLDADLYDHIRATVELLDGDGASDEQHSLRLLTSLQGDAGPLFP